MAPDTPTPPATDSGAAHGRPDPFDVLEVTLGLDVRPVRLDDHVTVVRTLGRHDNPTGNAVHHRAPVTAGRLDDVLADAARRLAHPDTTPRVVVHHDERLVRAARARDDVRVEQLVVAVLDDAAAAAAAIGPRDDLDVATPADDRAWHGVTVLHRHAGGEGDDRARGAADERLRWWVAGQRQLVGLGRARFLRAERFGTPVGAMALVWEPRVAVDDGHAGLAVLTDAVVHPAHRRLGVARTLAAALVRTHLADFPRARVATVAPAGLGPGLAAHGWREHARLAVLTLPSGPGRAGGDR